MNNSQPSRLWRGPLSPLVHLANNWISLIGVILVTTATIFWLFLLPTTLKGGASSPYIGILTYMGIPALFFFGLALIPVGIFFRNRSEHASGLYPAAFLHSLGRMPISGVWSMFIVVTTMINIVVASQASYAAISYMDLRQFCGTTCHTVMQPEYTAYQDSPHSRVECVILPHRRRRDLVCTQQAFRRRTGYRGDAKQLSATHTESLYTTCVRHGKLARRVTGRRSTAKTSCGSSLSMPRTRRTRGPRPS